MQKRKEIEVGQRKNNIQYLNKWTVFKANKEEVYKAYTKARMTQQYMTVVRKGIYTRRLCKKIHQIFRNHVKLQMAKLHAGHLASWICKYYETMLLNRFGDLDPDERQLKRI